MSLVEDHHRREASVTLSSEPGCFARPNGSSKPARVHMRDPGFVNLRALPAMARGGYIVGLIATLAMLDPVLGGIDR